MYSIWSYGFILFCTYQHQWGAHDRPCVSLLNHQSPSPVIILGPWSWPPSAGSLLEILVPGFFLIRLKYRMNLNTSIYYTILANGSRTTISTMTALPRSNSGRGPGSWSPTNRNACYTWLQDLIFIVQHLGAYWKSTLTDLWFSFTVPGMVRLPRKENWWPPRAKWGRVSPLSYGRSQRRERGKWTVTRGMPDESDGQSNAEHNAFARKPSCLRRDTSPPTLKYSYHIPFINRGLACVHKKGKKEVK